jgi:murein DD-endopeptidase MepM/ murein hydrolase activator NlpD
MAGKGHQVKRTGRLTLATVGLSIAIACGGPTSPTPQPTPAPPATPSSTLLVWPVSGTYGRDWVINNYVDLDPTSGTLDYTGGSGSGAKTYNGHNGIDIDAPNFRWMDNGVPLVVAAASGVVTSIHDGQPDRNTSCAGTDNFVRVRHPDGLTALYGHLRKGSVAVSVGQQVSAGDILGVVGSSGCSTAPHLHFELRNAANGLVDPFRLGLWVSPPPYNPAITLMDLVVAGGEMTAQQIKDPAPNVTSIARGSILGVGVSMAGGQPGDLVRMVITDPAGATFSDTPMMVTPAQRHSYWHWTRQLSPIAGVWTVSFFVNGELVKSHTVAAV